MIFYKPKVNGSTVVRIKCSKDVLAEVFCIATGNSFDKEDLLCSFLNLGKIFEYMAMNFSLLSSPLGQSFRKPSYHSCNWKMIPQCCSGWSLSSFLSCRCQRMRVLGFPSTVAWNDSDVPNGQNDWPFWTTLDPFGPLWNIDKPCHVLEIWDALCYCRLHFKDKLVDDSAKLWGR